MRSRRFLLVTTALSSVTLVGACRKEPAYDGLPGNPKGSFYDDGGPVLPHARGPADASAGDEAGDGVQGEGAPTSATPDGGAARDGSAGSAKPDATPKHQPVPVKRPLPGNPKGSHYDDLRDLEGASGGARKKKSPPESR